MSELSIKISGVPFVIIGSLFEFGCLPADILPLFGVLGLLLLSALLRLEAGDAYFLIFDALGLKVSRLATFSRSWLLYLLPGLSMTSCLCEGKGDGPSSQTIGAKADLLPRFIVGMLAIECRVFMFVGCSMVLSRKPF